ncbi:MAG: hypothetical protein K0U37_06630 [Gammaproteobacteria bacterium]|nr:hypothetical protein [Gammaproteobacteria bacterium]
MTLKKTNLLVASSSIDEAITQCVLKNKHAFSVNIEVVLIHELITDFSINDELSDHESIIRWFKPNQYTLSNQTHFLLNRTLSISDDLFLNFIQKDRDYAKREFEAYLGYSFNSFKGIGNQTVNGICENLYSLPEQWQKIKTHTALNTPNYYWGPKKLCHLTKRIVYSNIYNVFNWLITQSKPQAFHVFCFEKPKGHPLFALFLGEKY